MELTIIHDIFPLSLQNYFCSIAPNSGQLDEPH